MAIVCANLAGCGLNAVSISIDDFYLTRAEQALLAERHPTNPYLQHRGYPGTHDIDLCIRVLERLRTLRVGESIRVPGYNRFAHNGIGDRLPRDHWRILTGPLHLIVLEGWMLGFTPVPRNSLTDENLQLINELLARYKAWLSLLNGFILLDAEDHLYVRDWRLEAEKRAVAEGKTGMLPEQIRAFVENFLPAYTIYLPGLRAAPPTRPPHMRIIIDRDRLPIAVLRDWTSPAETPRP
jgi:D-glycerate 3-kinase